MAFIRMVGEDEAGPELAPVYEAARRRFSFVPDVVKVMGVRPRVAAAQADLRDELLGDASTLGARKADLVSLAVSGINGCRYCGSAHAGMLAQRGDMTPEEAARAFHDWRMLDLPPEEVAMLEFAEKLTFQPAAITAADVEALRTAGFGDAEIYDIVLLTAYRNFMNRVNDGLGVPLERLRGRFGDAVVDATA
jgi:uncharacterized peroxidase-related enzyme